MKNVMKAIFVLLASISLVSSATAGEITVTGSAKATYNIISGYHSGTTGAASKGMGIANDFDFGAKGELDNGITWNYQVQMDTTAGSGTATGTFDDSRLEFGTSYGTLAIYNSEGGLEVINSSSASAYARPTDSGITSGIVDGLNIGGFANVQYHSPAGMLPLGAQIKAAYATGQNGNVDTAGAQGIVGDDFGNNAQQFQLSLKPVDGLTVSADYYSEGDAGTSVKPVVQQAESGGIAAKYSMGAVTVGAARSWTAPLILGTSATASKISNTGAAASNGGGQTDVGARQYTTTKMSVGFNVNENLSVSYEQEKSERELIANAAQFDIKSKAVQAAYTVGGMTLAVSHGSTDNASYTNNSNFDQTLLALTIAF